MAFKCNSCGSTSDEQKDCCGAPMAEETTSSDTPATEAPASTEETKDSSDTTEEGEEKSAE